MAGPRPLLCRRRNLDGMPWNKVVGLYMGTRKERTRHGSYKREKPLAPTNGGQTWCPTRPNYRR